MRSKDRKAKVTPETLAESALLRTLWNAKTDKPSQAEFGELYGVGTQGAVSQFLKGDAPLSLKAAKGFATGLGCPISAFSNRLAAEVESASAVNGRPALTRASDANWPFTTVTPDQYFEVLSQAQRDIIEAMAHSLVNSRDAPEKHQSPEEMSASRSTVAKTA